MLTKMISVSEGQNLLTPKADLVIPLSALPWDLSQFQFLQMQIEWRRKRKEGGGNEQARPTGVREQSLHRLSSWPQILDFYLLGVWDFDLVSVHTATLS